MSVNPLDQSGQLYPVACAACLGLTGTKTAATWITSSRYFLCDAHRDIDIAELIKLVGQRQRQT